MITVITDIIINKGLAKRPPKILNSPSDNKRALNWLKSYINTKTSKIIVYSIHFYEGKSSVIYFSGEIDSKSNEIPSRSKICF